MSVAFVGLSPLALVSTRHAQRGHGKLRWVGEVGLPGLEWPLRGSEGVGWGRGRDARVPLEPLVSGWAGWPGLGRFLGKVGWWLGGVELKGSKSVRLQDPTTARP